MQEELFTYFFPNSTVTVSLVDLRWAQLYVVVSLVFLNILYIILFRIAERFCLDEKRCRGCQKISARHSAQKLDSFDVSLDSGWV